ncbi:MAG: CopG family transcriptional regulator [Hyphomicrobiales bacterium]|nr:CopG family transcriptional regulator [Hyphomicrobiales bacterium]
MKRRITVQLPEQLVERLEAAAARQGASKSAIVHAALDQLLSADTGGNATVSRRLKLISRQLEHLEQDLRIVNETVALHARYHLTVTPPLSTSQHRAACALGLERFEVFAAQIGRRVHLGTPLMRETMYRITTINPDLCARAIEEGVPLGAPIPDSEPDKPASAAANEQPEPSAVAREGGSNACFPEQSDRQAR